MRINKQVLDVLSLSFVRRTGNSTVGGNIKPDVTDTHDLGSTNLRFDNIYAKSVIADTLTGGTGTDHGALVGLGDDDHTQYLLANGTRQLSGNLAVGAGVTIDGIDISAHAADTDIHADHSVISVIAGSGLTGGGTIDASRTLNVGAGNGIVVSADSVAVGAGDGIDVAVGSVSVDVTDLLGLGMAEDGSNNLILDFAVSTPSTIQPGTGNTGLSSYAAHHDHYHSIYTSAPSTSLTYATSNIEGTSNDFSRADHIHAITNSSDVSGGSASILSSTADGYLSLARLGVGVTPDVPLHVRATTGILLKLDYDASNFAYAQVSSTGNVTYASTGDIIFSRVTPDTTLYTYFLANNAAYMVITSNNDNSGADQGGVLFRDYTTYKWGLWKTPSHALSIYDYTSSLYVLSIAPNGNILWTPTPSGIFEIRKGGEQLRLAYDATYYTQFTVSSSGVLTIDAVGDAVVLQTNNKIGSVDFTSRSEGWEVQYDGTAEFRSIYADELRVQAFTAEIYSALIGALVITKSRGRLASDMRIPFGQEAIVGVDQTDDYFIVANNHHSENTAGLNIVVWGSTGNNGGYIVDHTYYDSGNTQTWIYVTTDIPSAVADGNLNGQTTIYMEDLEELANTAIFDAAGGDWLRFRMMDMSNGGLLVADAWAQAYTYTDLTGINEGKQSWIIQCRDDGGVMGEYIYRGAIVLDYGQSGDGTWEVTVLDQGNSPYSQVTTWDTNPYTPANHTVWVRTGNLDGIGTLTEQYGIWMGQGTDEDNDSQIIMSDIGARIINTDLYVRASGTARVIASTDGYISAGQSAPTTYDSGVGFWAGFDGASSADIFIGNSAGAKLLYDGSAGSLNIYGDPQNYIALTGNDITFWADGNPMIRMNTGATAYINIGDDGGGEYINITASGIGLYGGGTQHAGLSNAGTFWVGTSSVSTRFQYDTTSGLRLFSGSTAYLTVPPSGNATLSGNFDVTGAIIAGTNAVYLNSAGIAVRADSSFKTLNSYKIYRKASDTIIGTFYIVDATTLAEGHLEVDASSVSGMTAYFGIVADGGANDGSLLIKAIGNTSESAGFSMYADAGLSYIWGSGDYMSWPGDIGIGVDMTAPSYDLHIYTNDTSTAQQFTIEQNSTGDASMGFLTTGVRRWALGIDNSDSDNFKIGYNATLGTNNLLTITTTGVYTYGNLLYTAGYQVAIGGLRAGSNADPGDGNVSVQNDVTAGGHGKFGGGLYVGSTGVVPATGAIRATGNASIAGGLYVGSSTTTTSTGYVEASSHVVANGNFFGRSSDHYFKTSVNIGYSSDVDSNRFKLLNESVNYRIEKAYAGTCSLWINYVGNGAGTRVVRISNGNGGYGNIHADNFVNESRRDSKSNIRSFKTDIPSALDIVDQINVVAFEKPNSGSRSNKRRIGMIAEELYEVLPEVVATEYDTGAPEGIDYSQLVPVLIEAIKELKEEVRRLS